MTDTLTRLVEKWREEAKAFPLSTTEGKANELAATLAEEANGLVSQFGETMAGAIAVDMDTMGVLRVVEMLVNQTKLHPTDRSLFSALIARCYVPEVQDG